MADRQSGLYSARSEENLDKLTDNSSTFERNSADSSPTKVTYAALVIKSSELDELAEESQKSLPPPSVKNSHLSGDTSAKITQSSWRTILRSPLGTFLTGARTSYSFVQLAGHKGDFATGQAGILYKRASDYEKKAYEDLSRDPLRAFAPWFYKTVTLTDQNDQPAEFLEMQDLLSLFDSPAVMDIKIGCRTFLEVEVSKTKRRMDLLEKMIKVDPSEPTDEERELGITKARYMIFREQRSSTKTFSFRIEAIKTSDGEPRNDFKTIQSRPDVFEALASYFPEDPKLRREVARSFLKRMDQFYSCLSRSDFFTNHELIGSSLLFLYDESGAAQFWMIDFGKTVPSAKPLRHDLEWELGNHEDGYLIGLNNLKDMLLEIANT